MVKATWIDAIFQPNVSCNGPTKSVHPYCKLAIIVMQTMPINNCTQRFALLFSETMTCSPAATLIFYAPLLIMARECATETSARKNFFCG